MHTKDIIGILGPRRAGKITILFQIMDYLERQGIGREAMLHINCEEPALFSQFSIELLDNIYETYRGHISPSGKVFVFIDEIQNIPKWERWVRARSES